MTTLVHVSGGSDVVRTFSLDLASGSLALRGEAPSGEIRPGYLAFSTDRRHAYGVGYVPGKSGAVVGFRVDPSTGALVPQGSAVDTGAAGGTHVAIDPSGRFILTAHFQGNAVAVLRIGADGAPGPLVSRLAVSPEAHQVVFDGRFVFVPCRSGDVVHQFVFDETAGALAPNNPATAPAGTPGAGPRHMIFHGSRRFAWVVNELDGTVTRYGYDSARGTLTPSETVSTVPPGFRETASAHVLVHPNGRLLFASNRTHGSIAVFAIDETTGKLTPVGIETGGGQIAQPRNFAIDPSGRWLLVADQKGGLLLVFAIDMDTGKLRLTGQPVTGLGAPTFVAALPFP